MEAQVGGPPGECSAHKAQDERLQDRNLSSGRLAAVHPSRLGGLILAELDDPIAVATLAIADSQRSALVDLLHRYGRRHPTGTITIPDDCLTTTVRYTSAPPPTDISEKHSL